MGKITDLLIAHSGIKAMAVIALVVFCMAISVFSVFKLGPNNAIEKEADAIANKELGTNIDFDEIIDDIDELKKK